MRFYDGAAIYPGGDVGCPSRCDDMEAEVRRSVSELADFDARSVTFHTIVTADGNTYVVNRSGGGSTWIAVATLTDGSRRVLLTGCGVGINPEMCFASEP